MHSIKYAKTHKKTGVKMSVKIIFSIIGAAVVPLFSPIAPYLVAVFFIVLGDQISGTWAALKRGERFSSKIMGRTVEKIIFYCLAIILSEVLRAVFFADFPSADRFTFAIASFIAFREFWSVIENVSDITGLDIAGLLGDKIRQMITPKK